MWPSSYAQEAEKPVIIIHNSHRSRLYAMISGTEFFNNIIEYTDPKEVIRVLNQRIQISLAAMPRTTFTKWK